MVGPSESKGKTSSSTPDSKANRVVVTKASSSGKPSNRVVIGSLPETITPSRLKELLQGIGPIQVNTVTTLACWYIGVSLIGNPGLSNIFFGKIAIVFIMLRKRWQNQLHTKFVTTLKIPWYSPSPC